MYNPNQISGSHQPIPKQLAAGNRSPSSDKLDIPPVILCQLILGWGGIAIIFPYRQLSN